MQKPWSALLLVCLGLCIVAPGTTAAQLTGIVRDNLGVGLSNLTVKASYYDSAVSGQTQTVATTDATGHFSFSGEEGPWDVFVAPSELNARGYLSVATQYILVYDNASLRFTTRKLDFSHRIVGQLADETGQPLEGRTLRARIVENNALFETNVVTGPNGAFQLAATPAAWTLLGPEVYEGVTHLFGEPIVEVEVTNIEKHVTITAPRATSTILVTPTNLGGWFIVAQAEGFGRSFNVVKTVPTSDPAPLALEVFNGVWRVSVTNRGPNGEYPFVFPQAPVTPPAPFLVAVTNEGISLMLSGTNTSAPRQYRQCVRLVTAGGAAVTNATLSAWSANGDQYHSIPLPSWPGQPPLCGPDAMPIYLAEGLWTITASTRVYPVFTGWDVSREIVITTNEPLPGITLVFPDPGVGPRIFGAINASGGPPEGSHLVYLQTTNNGTNYLATLLTDGLGQFGTNVPPGRWEVQAYANCPLASVVVVSNQDVELNYAFLVPEAVGEPIPISVSAVDDRGELAPDTWVRLSGFDYQYFPADPLVTQELQPGIWHVSPEGISYSAVSPVYQLQPTLRWQLAPGAAPTNLILVTRRTTSRIEGRLRDQDGRLLMNGYAGAWTSQNGTNFWTYGAIASGYFSLNVFPGEWQVGAGVSSFPDLGGTPDGTFRASPTSPVKGAPASSRYTTPAPCFVRVSNEVARCEFVATNIPETVTLTVTIVREDGGPLNGVNIFAYGPDSRLYSPADANGSATFLTSKGANRVSAHPGVYEVIVDPQLWPYLDIDLSAPSNHVLLVARRPVTCIPGTISNAPTLGLQPQISATAFINGTNYFMSACPDVDGHFCVPAIPGQWTVAMNSSTLPGNGIQTVDPREVIVPPTGTTPRADFTLTPIVGDFRTARLSPPVLLADGRLRLELEGQAPLTWRIERSENLRDWTLVAIQSAAYRSLVIEETPEPLRRAAFYRAVWSR